MKKSLVITMAISLIMPLTLALPAFAAPPRGGAGFIPNEATSGGGNLQIVRNPDNTIDVTIRLVGAEPDYVYGCMLWWPDVSESHTVIDNLVTDDHGRGMVTYTSPSPWEGTRTFRVTVGDWPWDYISSHTITLSFP